MVLREDLKTSASLEIVEKLDRHRRREDELETQVRDLKRQIEKMKIKYER
jgi:TolA-binding protein